MTERVWIVQDDEAPDYRVLGVFETEAEASDFVREVSDRFPAGVIYASFPLGFRYDRRPGFVSFGPRHTIE